MRNGYKMFTSPPPASGVITAAIIKIFDQFGFNAAQRFNSDVYIKFVEAMKWAYGQRSKLGDTNENPYESEIENVSYV